MIQQWLVWGSLLLISRGIAMTCVWEGVRVWVCGGCKVR